MPSTVNIVMNEKGNKEMILLLSLHALAVTTQDCENLKLVKQLDVTEEVYKEENVSECDEEDNEDIG